MLQGVENKHRSVLGYMHKTLNIQGSMMYSSGLSFLLLTSGICNFDHRDQFLVIKRTLKSGTIRSILNMGKKIQSKV